MTSLSVAYLPEAILARTVSAISLGSVQAFPENEETPVRAQDLGWPRRFIQTRCWIAPNKHRIGPQQRLAAPLSPLHGKTGVDAGSG